MRILVMGGTWFLGRAIVDDALRRGWDVTTFNRGRSGVVEGADTVRGDRTSPDDLKRLASHGPWDAVIDTSSSEFPPRDVLLATDILRPAAARWVHVSTVSVYQGWPHHPLTEDSPCWSARRTPMSPSGTQEPMAVRRSMGSRRQAARLPCAPPSGTMWCSCGRE